MEIKTHEIKQSEHLLAEKAQKIFEHQKELKTLSHQKKQLEKHRPISQKVPLSYEESIEFGKQFERHEKKMQAIELKIQKIGRELNALQLQAKKFLPVSEVKIKVSTDGSPCQTFCIEHIRGSGESQAEEHFEVEPL